MLFIEKPLRVDLIDGNESKSGPVNWAATGARRTSVSVNWLIKSNRNLLIGLKAALEIFERKSSLVQCLYN